MERSDAVLVRRPARWDEPLDPFMDTEDVKWLETSTPFATIDPASFPKSTPLSGILRNDCRVRRCTRGEIIVRQGDYGHSAFLVLSGKVRASLDNLPEKLLGQSTPTRQSWLQSIAQLWSRPKFPEARSLEEIVPSRDTLIRETENHTAVFVQDFDAVFKDNQSIELGPGELFGEVAAMYRTPHSATVIAEEDSTVVEIRWQGLRLLQKDRMFCEQLEQHYRKHWLIPHLREISLLRFLDDEAIRRIADATILRSYGRIEWNIDYRKNRSRPVSEQIEHEPLIIREGTVPTELIIIRTGFARLSRCHGAGHQTTSYLGKGSLFGLSEIANNFRKDDCAPLQTLTHSLRAVGFVDTLHIPIEVVISSILPYIRRKEITRTQPSSDPSSDYANPERVGQAGDGDASHSPTIDRRTVPRHKPGEESQELIVRQPQHISTGLVEFLVQERLTNGRQAMVIDLDRCTRCDDCVRACSTTHQGNPRMARTGLTFDRIMFAQACMHCTDPVCMVGCPTGAIARDEETGTVRIAERICIGCGTCASACPYNNIQMAEVRNQSGQPFVDSKTNLPILKATKCDFCQSQPAGPACQNACPHDALARIDLSQTDALDEWLGRRRS